MADVLAGATATADPLMTSMGLLSWSQTPHGINAAQTPVSQTLYGIALPTYAGVRYTGVKLNIGTAGVGTLPTSFFVGLATQVNLSSIGNMLAQSADQSASAALTSGGQGSFPFTSVYQETASGMRIVLFTINGAFGTTNVTLSRGTSGNTWNQGSTNPAFVVTAGSAVTALAANGSPLASAYSGTGTIDFWAGLY